MPQFSQFAAKFPNWIPVTRDYRPGDSMKLSVTECWQIQVDTSRGNWQMF